MLAAFFASGPLWAEIGASIIGQAVLGGVATTTGKRIFKKIQEANEELQKEDLHNEVVNVFDQDVD